jgi:phage tail tape-measure protein
MNYVPTGAIGRLGYAGMATGAGIAEAIGIGGTGADVALSATGAIIGVSAIPVVAAVGAAALGYKIKDEAGQVLNDASANHNDDMEEVLEVVNIPHSKRVKEDSFVTPSRRVPQNSDINFTPQNRPRKNAVQAIPGRGFQEIQTSFKKNKKRKNRSRRT